MQNQHTPVLIFAQSGRFLSQSATQAGYPVWVADFFGDQDTLSVAKRWQQLPLHSDFSETLVLAFFSKLTKGEFCTLICGSGIENFYTILDHLPENIQLTGNTVHTIHSTKTPTLFFNLLDKLDIAYPRTQFERPDDGRNWLVKADSGLGGTHIHYLNQQADLIDCYFQCFVNGTSGSALFIANGKQAQLISINKQSCTTNSYMPFRISSIETSWSLSEQHQQQLEQAIKKISSAIQLVGLNSIDFILSEENELLVLEINPRPSASAELIDLSIPLFQHHLNACRGILPNTPITTPSGATTSLRYLYAIDDLIIPPDMVWPPECSDLPATTTFIKQHEPICTSIVKTTRNQNLSKLHQDIENRVTEQLQKLEK